MTLRKILVLSTVLGMLPFCSAWASEGQADDLTSLGGGITPRVSVSVATGAEGDSSVAVADEGGLPTSARTVSVDKEKEEADEEGQTSSSSEELAEEFQPYAGPMTKAELYKALFGASADINRSCFSFQSPFDAVLKETTQARDALLEQLKKTAVSVGLKQLMANAGETFLRFKRSKGGVLSANASNIQESYAAEDLGKIISNIYMLQETYLLATSRNSRVTIDDLIALKDDELNVLYRTLDVYEEKSFLEALINSYSNQDNNNSTSKLAQEGRAQCSESEHESHSVMRTKEEKEQMLQALKQGKGAFNKSAISARGPKKPDAVEKK